MQLLFGGSSIRDFVLIMLFGVIVGTFSTIFIATILIGYWHKNKGTKETSGQSAKLPEEKKDAALPA